MQAVGFGVLGVGVVARAGILPHLSIADVGESARLVGVCDIDVDRARQCADEYRARCYPDYEAMLADPEVDAVAVCTPIHLHYDQIRAALDAGKHVYTNKTMTDSAAEAREILAMARDGGLRLVASPGQPLQPVMERARTLVEEGALGRLYWCRASCCAWGHEYEWADMRESVDAAWYYQLPGGGPLRDMGVYALHAMTFVLGQARAVSALSRVGLPRRRVLGRDVEVEAPDNVHLLLEFDGVVAGHLATTFASNAWELEFHGSEGRLDVLDPWGHPRLRLEQRGQAPVIIDPGAKPWTHGEHGDIPENHVFTDVMELARSVSAGCEPAAHPEAALHVISVIEAAETSARTGSWVEIADARGGLP